MSTEVVKEAKLEEEPRQCTKKEKLGHAIGVLGHDSMYTLWSTWTTPFLTYRLNVTCYPIKKA